MRNIEIELEIGFLFNKPYGDGRIRTTTCNQRTKIGFLKYSEEYRRIPLRIFAEFPGIPIFIRQIPWQ
jgi:hypothetical protein